MAAILLIYVDREDAFNIMLNILNKDPYSMKEYFVGDMPALRKSFYVLLCLIKKFLPKLHKHMIEEMYIPSMYATHWFMTIFSTRMPLELTLRIWDIFFIEGHKILYRIILAIFKLNEKELLKNDCPSMCISVKAYLNETN